MISQYLSFQMSPPSKIAEGSNTKRADIMQGRIENLSTLK
jgi:hypothetical protein